MSEDKVHIRHSILFEYNLGKTVSEAVKDICQACGESAVSERTVRRWFDKFAKGNKSIEDEPREGRPVEIADADIEALLNNNPRMSAREIADTMGLSDTAVLQHLHQMGKVCKFGRWIPHELTENIIMQRLAACMSLLSRHSADPFLDRIVTGDEKWVVYVNTSHKRQWVESGCEAVPTPKPELHQRKVMLCVWWGVSGIIHFELLPTGLTITAERYCDQLSRVYNALLQKRPALVNRKNVILLHDNARPHVAKIVKDKLLEMGWETLAHPPYSPDLAPSDYYLFRSLQNYLAEKRFENEGDVQHALQEYFESKSAEFYRAGINSLPARWQQVIDNDGCYLTN